MSEFATELDPTTFGQRLRHLRRKQRLTLAELGRRVDRAPSLLSLMENGKREPRPAFLRVLADALNVPVEDLASPAPPTRRAELEIALREAQNDPLYADLGLPELRPNSRLPDVALEHIVALYTELKRRTAEPIATPEEARSINTELRLEMRKRGNYFPEIESVVHRILSMVGHGAGPLPDGLLPEIAKQLGYTLHYATELPITVRSVTDLRNRRVFLEREPGNALAHRTTALKALGHIALEHDRPRDFEDFLRQRVEANYFAAAMLMPEYLVVPQLIEAKAQQNLAVEDLRDAFSVSYEMAAHRFTNLATHHLDLACHFARTNEAGIIDKAYECDGVVLPTDDSGGVEGQRMCRYWAGRRVFHAPDPHAPYYQYTATPAGTFWCVAYVPPGSEQYAVTLGVEHTDARWFRGRETTNRATSRCPTGECCLLPPADLARQWEDFARPQTRLHTYALAAFPSGYFPGVDETDVYRFLERHSGV